MQEFKDVLSIEAKVLRQNHSSVWHTVRNVYFLSILCLSYFVLAYEIFQKMNVFVTFVNC